MSVPRSLTYLGGICGIPCGPREVRPKGAQLKLKPSMLPAFGLDLASSLLVFIAHILTLDTMFASTIAVVSVLLCDTYALHMAMDVNYGLVRSAGFECMQH